MDHAKVATEVVEAIGGPSNISAAAHCATRLRLVVVDPDKINQQALDDNEELKGTFAAGGMFQIIVGPGDVDQVFQHMVDDHGVRQVSKDEAKDEAEQGGNLFSRFIKMIADIFVPILPALIAGGLLMALHSVLKAEGLFAEQSVVQMFPWLEDYDSLINLVSSAAFASLPILVGFSSAKRFGGNVYLGAAMGAAMVSPSLLSAYSMAKPDEASAFWSYSNQSSVWHLFGLEVTKVGYQAMVIPTLVVTWILCLIEKRLHKVFKGTADFLLTPLITLLVTGFLAFVVVGPITREISNQLTSGIDWLYGTLGPVGGLLFGFFYSPIVVTGLHQSFPAIEIPLLPSNGGLGDFIFPVASMANVAQGAAALAVFFKCRNAKMKGLAGAGGVSAVFGITEPAIFGVNLRLRWPFFIGMGAAAIGSAGVALLGVRGQALGAAGFAGFVSIIPASIPAYLALEVLVFVLAFAATLAYASTRGRADMADGAADAGSAASAPAAEAAPAAAPAGAAPAVEFSDEAKADLTLTSPMAGTAVPLGQVKDESFAKGMLGPGIAIEPSSGVVVAPCDGKVTVAFPTGHAYGIKSASGVQVLIHIGMDTVKLDGKGFTPKVAKGDVVRRGDVLAEVDLDVIREAGYDTVTPVVVTNKKKFASVTPDAEGEVAPGGALLTVVPKEAAQPTA
ncbi:PTS beta-glucoside transporter subunit IIBCA [Schaalia georgiae]|nr:PTS beta-glucoside transporter subunit IIBCA [Schaalia georgiae]